LYSEQSYQNQAKKKEETQQFDQTQDNPPPKKLRPVGEINVEYLTSLKYQKKKIVKEDYSSNDKIGIHRLEYSEFDTKLICYINNGSRFVELLPPDLNEIITAKTTDSGTVSCLNITLPNAFLKIDKEPLQISIIDKNRKVVEVVKCRLDNDQLQGFHAKNNGPTHFFNPVIFHSVSSDGSFVAINLILDLFVLNILNMSYFTVKDFWSSSGDARRDQLLRITSDGRKIIGFSNNSKGEGPIVDILVHDKSDLSRISISSICNLF
jgi:hypothetical protein